MIIHFSGFPIERAGGMLDKTPLRGEDALWYALNRYSEEHRIKAVQIFLTTQNRVIEKEHDKLKHTRFIFFPRRKPWVTFSYFVKNIRRSRMLQINTFPKPFLELPIVLLAKLFKVRVIYFIHNVYDFSKLGFLGKLLSVYHKCFQLLLADCIIVYTNYQKGELLRSTYKQVFVFPSGVDVHIFKPHGKIRQDEFIILFVGIISPIKEVEEIIFALSDLEEEIKKEVTLWIVGPILDKRYFETLVELLEKAGIKHRFFGYIPREKLPNIYSEADIFVNMRHDEAFGKVFIEAMSCGTPIIGKMGALGPEEIIREGWNGFLVRDVNDLKTVILKLIKNRDMLNNMSKNCRSFVISHYTYEKTYEVLRNIYDRYLRS